MPNENKILKSTYHGVVWTLADMLLSKGFPLAVIIMLARILGPEEFGLYGILVFFTTIGILLSESGLTSSLIRQQKVSRLEYSTVFYMNLVVNLVIYLVIYLIAPFIAHFFAKPVLKDLVRVISISYILSAFTAVHLAILNKKMRFKKIMLLNLPGAILGGVLGIVMAYRHYGIWSIVYMTLAAQFVTSCLLMLNRHWKPSFEYSSLSARMHFKFGVNVLLSGFIDAIFKNSYNIIIAKFYPMQSLAFFERARSLQEYPTMAMTAISNKVSYPLFAKFQANEAHSNSVFKYFLQGTFFVNTPMVLILAGIAKPLFLFLLGASWLQAVPYFQILCMGSIFYPHHAYNLNVLKVKGRSDLFLKLEVIKKIMMGVVILISAPFGMYAMLWGMAGSSAMVLYINIYYSGRYMSYDFKRQVVDLLPIMLIGLSSFLFTNFLCRQLQSYSLLTQISCSSSLGLLSYLLLNSLFNRTEFNNYLNLIRKR